MKYLLLLPLFALACSSSAAVIEQPPALPTVTQAAVLTPTAEGRVCASVIAVESVNVRNEANDVVGQFLYGEVVIVEDGEGDWWLVKGAGLAGRVRSTYLLGMECP